MLRNEKGFTYPLTLCIILVSCLFLSIETEQYLSDKRLMKETETILKQEYYLLSSMKRTEVLLMEGDEFIYSGTYHFADGHVKYNTSELTESLYQVTFKAKIGSNDIITGYGYYDIDLKKMIKWIEKN